MKCLAMRIGGADQSEDVNDIKQLGQILGVRSAKDAFGIIARYYPANHVSAKAQFGLEEMFGQEK